MRRIRGAYSWGYYVKINHAEGVDTLYAHLSSVAVSYGQYVHQGDVIGYVGSTGNSSGNHLHFELYLENNRVDPVSVYRDGFTQQVSGKDVLI